MIVFLKSIKNKLLAYILAIFILTIYGSFKMNNELSNGGPAFYLMECGFSESPELLYNPYQTNSSQNQVKVNTIYFWMILRSYDESYYQQNSKANGPLPIRVKILSKTGIDYGRAKSLTPITDERTYAEYNPKNKENFIYAYAQIDSPNGYLSINVVNLRNRTIECVSAENCQFDLELP